MSGNKVTRDTVPQDFTLGLALVDAIPVLLFGVNCLIVGQKLSDRLFILGAALCLMGGAGKVLWKLIVVLNRKNIWPLFVQMRILMPLGFFLMLLAAVFAGGRIQWTSLLRLPSAAFFAAGIMGMALMGVFAVKLDNGDVKTNWIEQLTNGAAQAAFLIGLLLL